MNKKMTLPQTAVITLFSIIMILAIFNVPGLSILSIGVSALFVVIAALSDSKGIFMSFIMVILGLVFFIDPVYIFDICLNFVIPGIIIGIITRNVLNYTDNNKFNPIFMGTIAFILGLIANYLISKYVFNINMLEEFTSVMKVQLSTQISAIQESVSTLASVPNITEESLIQTVLNIMPLILFSRAIILAILTYFLAIFTLKKIRKSNLKEALKEIKFSRFYLPGNAVLTSFILYILIMLLEILKVPLYTDLILVNLELIFYILFLIQGVSVAIFFAKKWLKSGQIIKFIVGIIAIFLLGVMGISILGMVDSIFDFRKVKSCELT
ncbi:MAG: DUF2232 domain-containing protein [Intestinibacter bartlettii]|uniref:DUF2232 domain-containing protein n=1 Tax=Intestinibacter bartlettii TaxID=261299 RepID=UPI0026F2BB66|nr:DUF2232 domain-containing protein [Intestinibacter bartlettii]MDO5009241.1 DUF2232 domain-containing protein [Intestinibacter bartlettii]